MGPKCFYVCAAMIIRRLRSFRPTDLLRAAVIFFPSLSNLLFNYDYKLLPPCTSVYLWYTGTNKGRKHLMECSTLSPLLNSCCHPSCYQHRWQLAKLNELSLISALYPAHHLVGYQSPDVCLYFVLFVSWFNFNRLKEKNNLVSYFLLPQILMLVYFFNEPIQIKLSVVQVWLVISQC